MKLQFDNKKQCETFFQKNCINWYGYKGLPNCSKDRSFTCRQCWERFVEIEVKDDIIAKESQVIHNCSDCGNNCNGDCGLYKECEFSVNSYPSKWIPNKKIVCMSKKEKFMFCPNCGADYNSADMESCWCCQQPLRGVYKPVITPSVEEVHTLLQSCAKKLGVNCPDDEKEKIYGK